MKTILIIACMVLGACTKPSETPSSAPEAKLETKDLQIGTGATIEGTETVKVHYLGKLPDGKVFDDTRKKGEALEFQMGAGQVIKGLDEGLKGMKIGGRREILVPAPLAYGERGLSNLVPPGSNVQLEVELIE